MKQTAKVDKNIGGIASILIQNGTLRLGDPIVVGTAFGKVRTLKNDKGEFKVIDYGAITTPAHTNILSRLETIYKGIASECETFIQNINKYDYLFHLCDVRIA